MSIPQRPIRKQGASRRAPPPPPSSPPPPSFDALPPPPPMLPLPPAPTLPPPPPPPSPLIPPSILPLQISTSDSLALYVSESSPNSSPSLGPMYSSALPSPPFSSTASDFSPPPIPSRSSVSSPIPIRPLSLSHSPSAPVKSLNASPDKKPRHSADLADDLVSRIRHSTNGEPSSFGKSQHQHQQSQHTPSTPTTSNPEIVVESDLKSTLDFIAANSWQNEAWTRPRNKARLISPPQKSVETADVVDLAQMIERMSALAWCNFCAKNLHYFSASLDPQDWLEGTFARLSHLLAIFVLMNPSEVSLRCKCPLAFRAEGGNMLFPLSKESSAENSTMRGLESEVRRSTKYVDGTIPTASCVEEAQDCMLLFLHAFLAVEGPVLLLWLITDLLNYEQEHTVNMTDTLAMHRSVERSLECIVKIFFVLQRVCMRQGCTIKGTTIRVGSCEGVRVCKVRVSAAAWIDREKVLWWMEAGVEEALFALSPFGVPERIGVALVELLLDHVAQMQEQSYTPYHIKKIVEVSMLPLITTACLLSKFDHLENILRYLTFVVVQRPENALVLVSADQLMFVMPTLLTAGTSCPSNKSLRTLDARLAEEKVGNALRNAYGLVMSVLHIYFTTVDTSKDLSNDHDVSAFAPSSLMLPPSPNSVYSTLLSSDPSPSLNPPTPTLCAVLFGLLDALEDTAHKWDPDTIARANVIFHSLLIKLTRSVKMLRRDARSFMWENVFQLCFAVEDHIWYNSCSPIPRASPRHFKTFELRGTPANVALIAQLDELLASLEPAVRDDDVQRALQEKKRIDLLRARLAEEREFWAFSIDLINVSHAMDPATLLKDKRYKIVESTSRLRCTHYGDPCLSSKLMSSLNLKSPRMSTKSLGVVGGDSSYNNRRHINREERKSASASLKLKKGTVDLTGKVSRFVGHLRNTWSEDFSMVKFPRGSPEDSSSLENKTAKKETSPGSTTRDLSPIDGTRDSSPLGPRHANENDIGVEGNLHGFVKLGKSSSDSIDQHSSKNDAHAQSSTDESSHRDTAYESPESSGRNLSPTEEKRDNLSDGNTTAQLVDTDDLPAPPPNGSAPSNLLLDEHLDGSGDDPELNPKCWTLYQNSDGQMLYLNTATKTMSSDRPPCLKGKDPSSSIAEVWTEYKDPNGESFYFNPALAQTTYDDSVVGGTREANRVKPRTELVSPRGLPSRSTFPPLSDTFSNNSPRNAKVSADAENNTIPDVSEGISNGLPRLTKEILAWREAYDESRQLHYFWNKLTHQTTKECPDCLLPFNVPQFWEETYDEISNRVFYFNTETKVSTFLRPSCLPRNEEVLEPTSEPCQG